MSGAVRTNCTCGRCTRAIYARALGSTRLFARALRSAPAVHCRAGATEAIAVESVRHLCEAAEEATALDGVRVVHKDARFLELPSRARGPCDLEGPADVVVFEVSRNVLYVVLPFKRALLLGFSRRGGLKR